MQTRIHILDEFGKVARSLSTVGELVELCPDPSSVVVRREIANDGPFPLAERSLLQIDIESTALNAGYSCRTATVLDAFARPGEWIWWYEFEG